MNRDKKIGQKQTKIENKKNKYSCSYKYRGTEKNYMYSREEEEKTFNYVVFFPKKRASE